MNTTNFLSNLEMNAAVKYETIVWQRIDSREHIKSVNKYIFSLQNMHLFCFFVLLLGLPCKAWHSRDPFTFDEIIRQLTAGKSKSVKTSLVTLIRSR